MPRQPTLSRGAQKSKTTASSSPRRPSLLTIPLELREEIYAHFIHDRSATLLDLLTVNKRLAREVKPFLYKRPLSFDGQCELFNWIDKVDNDCLRYVTDVRFKLLDINPETIVGALGTRLRATNATRDKRGPETDSNPYYQACFLELKRLRKVFDLLSNVRCFYNVACTTSDPQPPPQMLESFSKLLGHCFPHLRSLVSEERLFPIDFARNKPHLHRLRFPANTESNDADIANVFRRLSDLELEICRLSPSSGVAYDWGCMTDILPYVPPLQSLVLFERLEAQQPSLSEEVFVDAIEAMKRHLRSLRKMTLVADPPAGRQEAGVMRRNLLRFVEASSLRHVEVLGTYASIYRHLPGSAEVFVLRLDKKCTPSMSFAKAMADFMSHVKFRAVTAAKDPQVPKLSRLREIQVWVPEHPLQSDSDDDDDDDDDDGDEDPEDVADNARSRLQKIGIKFELVVNAESDSTMTGSEDRL